MKVSNEDIGLAAIIVTIAFAALSLGLFSDWNLGKADSIVAVVQGFATVVAIGLAGLFAYQKLNVFRTFYPHLTISHEISHRFVGDSYVHLSVTAILQNNSNVKIGELYRKLHTHSTVSQGRNGAYSKETCRFFLACETIRD